MLRAVGFGEGGGGGHTHGRNAEIRAEGGDGGSGSGAVSVCAGYLAYVRRRRCVRLSRALLQVLPARQGLREHLHRAVEDVSRGARLRMRRFGCNRPTGTSGGRRAYRAMRKYAGRTAVPE